MSGLFEDDSEVRKIKKLPVPKKEKSPKKQTAAEKMLAKIESNSNLVSQAGSNNSSSSNFDKLDLRKMKKEAKSEEDDGRIKPTIDYIGDMNV